MLLGGDISHFYEVERRSAASIPLMAFTAACGFPSPAEDYLDKALDFNELLIVNPASTFAVRVTGDSMIDAGIFPHDIAVIDRSLTATDRCIVLALLDGAFTMKRYRQKDGKIWLQAENPAYQNILLSEESQFEIWGVVWRSIRMHL